MNSTGWITVSVFEKYIAWNACLAFRFQFLKWFIKSCVSHSNKNKSRVTSKQKRDPTFDLCANYVWWFYRTLIQTTKEYHSECITKNWKISIWYIFTVHGFIFIILDLHTSFLYEIK